jgi:acyl-coenzyme A synthetase/AMP-(fatty) acid ligase/lauroyl/myristoyl acyltransferase/acyl carrier protein
MTISPIPFLEEELYHTVGKRFQKVVSHLPAEHPAYIDQNDRISYQQLWQASITLAARLQQHLGKDAAHEQQLVATLLHPDWRELQAMMGVALSGHLLNPLAHDREEQQNRQYLLDYPIKTLLTTANLLDAARRICSGIPDCEIILLDELAEDGAAFAPSQIKYRAGQNVTFTSGSTGKPRGVIRTHAMGLLSSYLAATDLAFTPSDRITLTSDISLAMASTPTVGALMNGVTIYRRLDYLTSPTALYRWLADDRITIARAPAGLMRSLLSLPPDRHPLPDLRLIDTGGESFSRSEIEGFFALMNEEGVFNVRLASSEAGNYAIFRIGRHDTWEGERNPAGYVPRFTEVLVVDENRQPLPFGEEGELAVRGRFLAAGYLNDPEQTRARFVSDPQDPALQTYYTGDMGSLSADGLVTFLGRRDFRVKVRGFTIELEAVENAIRAIPVVSDAAVIVQSLPSGNKRLVAYYTTKDDHKIATGQLRGRLAKRLPQHMIPSVILPLDNLPQTPSGKVDRKALPMPSLTRASLEVPYRAPRTMLEKQLASIWEKLLDMTDIGIDDNFFELGGDSLISMQMVLLVESATGSQIPNEYFKQPTIANLTGYVDGQHAEELDLSKQHVPRSAPLNEDSLSSKVLAKLRHPDDLLYSLSLRARKPFQTKMLSMPYPEAMDWLLKWSQNSLVHRLLFHREKTILQNFLNSIEAKPEDWLSVFSLTLAGNFWAGLAPKMHGTGAIAYEDTGFRFWTSFAALIEDVTPEAGNRFARVNGFDYLREAYQQSSGVILLSYHGIVTRLATVFVEKWLGCEPVPVISPRLSLRWESERFERNLHQENLRLSIAKEQARHGAYALLRGYRYLTQGQIVRAYVDNGFSSRGDYPINVCGRQYQMRTGWADLAIQTGAAVIPVLSVLQPDGSIEVTFLPALSWDQNSPDKFDQTARLMEQFADFLTEAYRRYPESLRWKIMENHYTYPQFSTVDSKN